MICKNHKIEAYLRPSRQATTRHSILLYAGGDASFIKSLFIPREIQPIIWSLQNHISIQNTCNRFVVIAGTIDLVVNIETLTTANMTYNVVERLKTDVVLE